MMMKRTGMLVMGTLGALLTTTALAQNASGKFSCDNETNTIVSSVAAWNPETKSFYIWGLPEKFSDEELKALAIIEGGSGMKGSPKLMADKAFQKAAWDAQGRKRKMKYVMIRGTLKDGAAKVEWSNVRGSTLMYVKCLVNVNLNFSLYPGDKKPEADVTKAFRSFDFPLKDGATAKVQTVAFKHDGNPKGITTKVTWDYKMDAKVYTVE